MAVDVLVGCGVDCCMLLLRCGLAQVCQALLKYTDMHASSRRTVDRTVTVAPRHAWIRRSCEGESADECPLSAVQAARVDHKPITGLWQSYPVEMPTTLKEQGYFTASIGKDHFGWDGTTNLPPLDPVFDTGNNGSGVPHGYQRLSLCTLTQ